MIIKSIIKYHLLFALSSVLLACNADTYAVGDEAAGLEKNNPAEHKYPGKPHAPVYLKYSVPKNINAGDTLDIELQLRSDIDADELNLAVHVKDGDGMVLNSAGEYSFGVQQKGQHNPLTLSLQVTTDGLFYLNLSATLVNQDRSQSRSFTIPIKVGQVDVQKQLKQSGQLEHDSKGRPIIIMPAGEPR